MVINNTEGNVLRLVTNRKLLAAISEYGQKRLENETGISQAMICMVCKGERNFSPKVVIEKIVPTIWPDRHVMLSDIWELAK